MTTDDDSFARSLAALRPVKAEIDPADVFYEAGFSAGAARARRSGIMRLRIAAVALVAAGLSAGSGFYVGHQKGERTGYRAAVAAAPAAASPAATPQQTRSARDSSATPVEPSSEQAPEHPVAPKPSPPDEPASPLSRPAPQQIAASQSLTWQWIVERLETQKPTLAEAPGEMDSPLRIRPSERQWQELVNFRHTSRFDPRPPGNPNSFGSRLTSEVARPLTIAPSEEWLRAITTY